METDEGEAALLKVWAGFPQTPPATLSPPSPLHTLPGRPLRLPHLKLDAPGQEDRSEGLETVPKGRQDL